MKDLKEWLEAETQDFATGIDLLRQYGRNKALLATLSKRENSYTRQKLAYELGKLCPEPFTPAVQEVTASADRLEPATEPTAGTEASPAKDFNQTITDHLDNLPAANPMEAIIMEQAELFKKKAALSNQLADEMTTEARLELVQQIESITEKYNALAERKRVFTETGQLPAEMPVPATADPASALDLASQIKQLKGEQLNWRTKVSRIRKKLKEKPEDTELASELSKHELELQSLDLKLKTLK